MVAYDDKVEVENLNDILGARLNRVTPLGEYLGAKMSEAFDWTTIKQLHGYQPNYGPRLTKEEYEASEWYREGIPYEEGLSEVRAQAYAEHYDERRYRDSLIERSPTGARSILGFGAAMLASAVDPVNYIPILGSAAKAKAIGQLGVIGGRALVSAVEAGAGTAISDALIVPSLRAQGEDVGWQDAALDITFGAAIGAMFGGGSGLLEKRRMARLKLPMPARQQLGEAMEKALDDVASDVPVDVPVPRQAVESLDERTLASSLPEAAPVASKKSTSSALERVHDSIVYKEAEPQLALLPEEEEVILRAEQEGRLTEADRDMLSSADNAVEKAGKYHEAFLASVECLRD